MNDAEQKKKNKRWLWVLIPVVVLCRALASIVGDMLFICMIYGPHAYFDEGLRIEKLKPYILSTGTVLSDNLGFVGWFVDVVLWLGFVILMMYGLSKVSAVFKRFFNAEQNSSGHATPEKQR